MLCEEHCIWGFGTQGEDLALFHHELYTTGLGPPNQPDQIPLEFSCPPADQRSLSPNWCLCKMIESVLNSLVQIIDEDIKQNCLQYWALGNTTADQLPDEHVYICMYNQKCALKGLWYCGAVCRSLSPWISSLMWKQAYITFKCRIKFCINFGDQQLNIQLSGSE